MKKYIWLKHHKKLAIRDGSIIHWMIMHLIHHRIGYYQAIRIGRETCWQIFNWNGKHHYDM